MRKSILIVAPFILAAGAVIDMRIPAAIDIGSDTLVINGRHPVLIGTRLLNRHGRAIWHPALRYSPLPPALGVVTPDDDGVMCRGTGDATITISHGSLERQLLVRCRLVNQWTFHEGFTLQLNGPPREFAMHLVGMDGRPVTLIRGRASIRDTSVAKLVGSMIYPKSVGNTWINTELSGGITMQYRVHVIESMADTSLELNRGEAHNWPLAPAYYEVKLDSPKNALMLAALNANCALGHEGPQHFYCITKDSSGFIVANSTRHRASGHLSITRIPKPYY